MATIIHSNGSKWFGEEPDGLKELIDNLEKNALDVDLFGYFYTISENGFYVFRGNFIACSHVFKIETNEPDVYMQLSLAIGKNLRHFDNVNKSGLQ